MLRKFSKKTWIGSAAIIAIVITALVWTTSVSSAMTLDQATDLAAENIPQTAVFVNGEEGDNDFEIMFYDEKSHMKYKVEISKTTQKIKEIEAQSDNDRGSNNVKLDKKDVEKILKDRFSGITVTGIKLEREDGLHVYEADFKADNFYGEAEINPETGLILEYTVKAGSAITIPQADSNEKNPDKNFISESQAVEKALKQAGGGTVKDVDIEKEKGQYFYEVEILKGSKELEYYIDAETGKIMGENEFDRFFDDDDDYDDDDYDYDDDDDYDYDDDDDDDYIVNNSKKHKHHKNADVNRSYYDNDDDDDDDDDDDYDDDYDDDDDDDYDSHKTHKPAKPAKSDLISSAKAKSIVLNRIPGAKIHELELDREDGSYVYEGEAVLDGYEYEFEINAVSGAITDWEKELID